MGCDGSHEELIDVWSSLLGQVVVRLATIDHYIEAGHRSALSVVSYVVVSVDIEPISVVVGVGSVCHLGLGVFKSFQVDYRAQRVG